MVEFDPRVLRESRQMEIDFVNQLDVHLRRQTQRASGVLFIPTKLGEMPNNLSTARDRVRKKSNGQVPSTLYGWHCE